MMKPLSAEPHGVLDYLTGLLLLISPWLFGFNALSTAATYTMIAVGVVVLGLSLITNYPLGLVKAVPFPVHGVIETIGALGLLISPWVVGFSDLGIARDLAVIVAIAWLGIVALTNYSVFQTHRPSH
jgi:hypothetical protein